MPCSQLPLIICKLNCEKELSNTISYGLLVNTSFLNWRGFTCIQYNRCSLILVDARKKIRTSADKSRVSDEKSNDSSQFKENGKKLEANGSVISTGNSRTLSNGNVDNLSTNVPTGKTSTQADHIHGVAIPPATLLGMTSHLPPAQVASIHPVMHQQLQVYPNSASTLVLQSRLGQFQSIPAASPLQHGQNQQASTEVPQLPVVPVSKQAVHPDHSELHLRQGSDYSTVNIS